MKLEFNINDTVKVRLTEDGKAELKKQHFNLYQYQPPNYDIPEFELPKEDEAGYSEWQLWHLMSTFGKKIYLGGPNMFHTTIQIMVKEE